MDDRLELFYEILGDYGQFVEAYFATIEGRLPRQNRMFELESIFSMSEFDAKKEVIAMVMMKIAKDKLVSGLVADDLSSISQYPLL